MAIPTIVGVGASASGAGAVTPAYPASYTAVDKDIAITFVECDSSDTLTPPTNWALATSQSVTSGTTTKLSAIWRRLTNGEAAPQIADAGNHIVARMIVVRGCFSTGNPWNVLAVNQELTADTTVSMPTVTTTVADCLILNAFSTGQDIASTAGGTGYTNSNLGSIAEQMDNWTSSGTGGGFAMCSGTKATSGATGATTATLSLTANFKALMTIALRPAVVQTVSVGQITETDTVQSIAHTKKKAIGQVIETDTSQPISVLFPESAYIAEIIWYNEDSASPLTVSKPASFATGQILVAIIHQHALTDTTLTTPSGWTQQGSSLNGTNSQGKVFSIPFSGGLPATWDFPYSTSADVCLALFRIVNADTTPVINVASTNTTSLTSSYDSPTITPSGSTDLLLVTIGDICNNATFSVTEPTGTVDQGQTQASSTFMALAAASQQLRSASATGVRTWTSVSPTGADGGTFSVTVKSVAAGGPIIVTVNQVTEVDSAQAINRIKTKVATQITETDTSQSITTVKRSTVGQVVNTNTSQPISTRKTLIVNQVTNSNTSQSITPERTYNLSQISETDTSNSISVVRGDVVERATETDTASVLNEHKLKSIVQVTNTNTSQSITSVKRSSVGQITETDTVFSILVRKTNIVNQVSQSNTSNSITPKKLKLINIVTESDISQSILSVKRKNVDRVIETDSVQSISVPGGVDRVLEIDLSQLISVRKTNTLGLVTESDISQSVSKTKLKSVSQVSQSDTSSAITSNKKLTIGQSTETDIARVIIRQSAGFQITVNRVVEIDSSASMSSSKLAVINRVTNINSSMSLVSVKRVGLSQVTQTDSVQPMVRLKMANVVQVNETDIALAIGGSEAPLDLRGWIPQLHARCVYLKQKTFGGNPNYVKRIPVKIIDFAADGYPMLKCKVSGQTYGTLSVGIRPRSHPDANEVDVYVSF